MGYAGYAIFRQTYMTIWRFPKSWGYPQIIQVHGVLGLQVNGVLGPILRNPHVCVCGFKIQ